MNFGGSKGDFGNEINNQLYGTTEGGLERGGGGLNEEENRNIPNLQRGERFKRGLGSEGFNGGFNGKEGEGRRGNGGIGSEGTGGGEFNNRGGSEGGTQGRGFGGGPIGGEFNGESLEGGNFGGPRGQIPSGARPQRHAGFNGRHHHHGHHHKTSTTPITTTY
uniref:Uncharacterized protein n=1 Tax=Meloidogyne javanica TaxID=6303 RepID=A0A915LWI2_MELJA